MRVCVCAAVINALTTFVRVKTAFFFNFVPSAVCSEVQ